MYAPDKKRNIPTWVNLKTPLPSNGFKDPSI
jgi:hypothetical protein